MIALPALGLKAWLRLIGGGALLLFAGWAWRIDDLRARHKREWQALSAEYVQFRANIAERTAARLAEDRAHAAEVAARDRAIAKESQDDLESRLAVLRARARSLRDDAARPADRGGKAPLSAPGGAAGSAHETPGEDRLPAPALPLEDALTCSEQAVQLDALIGWTEKMTAARIETE